MTDGGLPIGYDAKDKKLVLNEAEAETVRHIFRRYLELRCLMKLTADLHDSGIVSKRRPGTRFGWTTFNEKFALRVISNVLEAPRPRS